MGEDDAEDEGDEELEDKVDDLESELEDLEQNLKNSWVTKTKKKATMLKKLKTKSWI